MRYSVCPVWRSRYSAPRWPIRQSVQWPRPEPVERAFHAQARFFHNVQVNLRRSNVFMPHEILHGADIGAGFHQVSAKAMSQYVRGDAFVAHGPTSSLTDGMLKSAIEHMMPPG